MRVKILASTVPLLLAGVVAGGELVPSPSPCIAMGRASMQIATALEAAHALQIVHRDLKPDNIFITARATDAEFVKVLDFGVAKLRGDPTATDDKLTATGMIIGTAPYMAPEQWQARPDIDGRADIYALGVFAAGVN